MHVIAHAISLASLYCVTVDFENVHNKTFSASMNYVDVILHKINYRCHIVNISTRE